MADRLKYVGERFTGELSRGETEAFVFEYRRAVLMTLEREGLLSESGCRAALRALDDAGEGGDR